MLPELISVAKPYVTDQLQLKIDQVVRADINRFVPGTPTLMLIDRSGVVKRVWVGQLPPDKEVEVIAAVQSFAREARTRSGNEWAVAKATITKRRN